MTILTSIILVVAVVAIALFIAYNAQRGTKALSEFKADYDNNAEVQEVVELAQELYNKDLRPIVAKKAPKKQKAVEQVETIAEVITPQVVEAVAQIAKVETEIPTTPVYVEAVLEPAKPKKKRKYYPRKPKTSI
jgi:predicted PurR-regulated permease PerM